MNNEAKLENTPAYNRQVHSALSQLSEPELVRLMERVKALRKVFRLIRPCPSKSTGAVTAMQTGLKIWSDELDRSLKVKQAKDTNRGLRNWDNEGGAVDHVPKPHVLTITAI